MVAVLTALMIGLPTDVIPNPVFGRQVPVTWWSYPVLALTAGLAGVLAATYVHMAKDRPARTGSTASTPQARQADRAAPQDGDMVTTRSLRLPAAGGLLSWFAVGCPVCNKLVLLAVGATGAVKWFAPIQPALAGLSLALLAASVVVRLRGMRRCPVAGRPVAPLPHALAGPPSPPR